MSLKGACCNRNRDVIGNAYAAHSKCVGGHERVLLARRPAHVKYVAFETPAHFRKNVSRHSQEINFVPMGFHRHLIFQITKRSYQLLLVGASENNALLMF